MVNISKLGDSAIKFTFTDNDRYLYNGEIVLPLNSLILEFDSSELVIFKKIDGDVFVTFLLDNSNFDTKAELESWFKENAVGEVGGGVDSGTVQTMIDESISGKADSSAVTEEISAAVSGKMDTSAYTVDASVNSASTNPVQNQALYGVLSYIYSQLPYLSVIENGDFEGSGNTNFLYKPNGGNVQYCTIQDGIGKDNSRGIVVTNTTAGQQFDTELFVKMNQIIKLGTKFHVEFDYKANKAINGVSTQSHGNPASYHYWDCIGSINFTDQWQHFSKTITVSSDMAGPNNDFRTICFTLGATADAEYYFDNFVITVEQKL